MTTRRRKHGKTACVSLDREHCIGVHGEKCLEKQLSRWEQAYDLHLVIQ